MEAINLKPMRIGEIFDVNFQILRKNFKTLIYLNFMTFLPGFILFCLAGIVLLLLYLANPMMFSELKLQRPDFSFIGFIVISAISLIGLCLVISISMLFNTYGIFRIFNEAIHGRNITWKESLKGSLIGVLFFFVAGMLLAACSFVLTFPLQILSHIIPILIIPQLIIAYGLQIFIFVTYPLIALEKIDPIRGLWRSCCLIWRNFGRALAVFLLYLLLSICAFVVVFIVSVIPIAVWLATAGKGIFQGNFDPIILLNPWLIIGALLVLTFILFLIFVLFNFYYGLQVILMYDLKMRSEGYGIIPPESTVTG